MANKYITIPGTDLKVSKLCLGCWQFNGGEANINWDPQPVETSKAILDKAIEIGCNFIDTAEAYNNSEATLGKILDGRRKDLVVASKFGYGPGHGSDPAYTAEDIEKSLTRSLASLQTDFIDLYQIHWPTVVGSNTAAVVAELERQKAKGTIRHYGVCNFGPENLREFIAAGGKPVTNQLPYNLLTRSIEYEVLPLCEEYDISILAYSPLQQGLLTGKFNTAEDVPEGRRRTRHFKGDSTGRSKHSGAGAEAETFQAVADIKKISEEAKLPMASVSLAWLLHQPKVVSVIAGSSRPEQVVANFELPSLDQSTVSPLTECTESVKKALGTNIDLYAKESRCK